MSYSGTPSDSDIDFIRYSLGDTSDNELLADTEITYQIDISGSKESALPVLARALLVRISKEVTQSVGDVSANYSDWFSRIKSLLASYETINLTSSGYCGGVNMFKDGC